MGSNEQVDAEAAAVAKTDYRVTLFDIESEVVGEEYVTADTLTVCVLALKNGYRLVGKSGCVDPENFNAELGRKFARENAVREAWPLLAFRLADKMLADRTPQELPETFDFGVAISLLRDGKKVYRAGWNGKGMWLKLQVPDAHSKMTLPYIYMEYPEGHSAYGQGSRVPWLASQTDMLAQDWSTR